MRKYFSILMVACALQLSAVTGVEAKPLSEKVKVAEIQTQKLDLNLASAEQLQVLPGIGLKKAQAIVAYRDSNGNFGSVEELAQVKGIGKKMLAKLSGKVVVK